MTNPTRTGGTPQRTTVTMIRRVSSVQRTGKLYIPAPNLIASYTSFADSHDGKVLYTTYTGRKLPENCRVGEVIVWAHKEGPAFIGTVVDNGTGYDPQTWQTGDPYQAPAPWSHEKQRFWWALKDIHAIDMNPDDWALAGEDAGQSLAELFDGSRPGLAVVYAVPKAGRTA